MKKLTLAEARQEIEQRELWLWRQRHWGKKQRVQIFGGNVVSDHDEDYVIDALFNIPNK